MRPDPARLAIADSPALPVTVSVALLSLAVEGEKRSTIVQAPAGARAEMQLFVTIENWLAFAPPSTGLSAPLVFDPVLVTMTIRSALEPIPMEPRLTNAGSMLRPVPAATPFKFAATDSPPPPATLRMALLDPGEVGLKATETVQVTPAATAVPSQVLLVMP